MEKINSLLDIEFRNYNDIVRLKMVFGIIKKTRENVKLSNNQFVIFTNVFCIFYENLKKRKVRLIKRVKFLIIDL